MELKKVQNELICCVNDQAYVLENPPELPGEHRWYWNSTRKLFANTYDDRVIAVYPQPDGSMKISLLCVPADPTMRTRRK